MHLLIALVIGFASGLGTGLLGGLAHAQGFPSKPIRLVVPFAAGGLIDGSARIIAPKLGEALGQPVVVDNRPGAGGTIGMSEVARATPDGHTLLFAIESIALAPHIYKKVGFDPEKDFAAVTQLLSVPNSFLVHPSVPVTNLAELAAYSKKEGGRLNAGSGGTGTAGHLGLELLKMLSGAEFTHVPYKGAAPGMTDFLAGQLQIFSVSTTMASPHHRAGKAKILAVASPQRVAILPNVPTTAEAGYPNLLITIWMGLLAPAGTSPSVIKQLHTASLASLNDPANAKRFTDQGLEIVGSSPEAFQKFVAAENAKYRDIVTKAKVAVE
ncbi:MAG: tripartite tricarboxylate transporter substrate binding protein [Burkholderiales bacterium]